MTDMEIEKLAAGLSEGQRAAKGLGEWQKSLLRYATVERHTHGNFYIQPEYSEEWRAAESLRKRGLVEDFRRSEWKIWLTPLGLAVRKYLMENDDEHA